MTDLGCCRVLGRSPCCDGGVWTTTRHTHIFFLLSLFFFKATACVLVYTGKVLLLWKLTVINWSFQVRRMRKTQKYDLGLFPVWAKTEISSPEKRLRHSKGKHKFSLISPLKSQIWYAMIQKCDTLTAKHLCLLIKSPDVEDSAADRKKRSLDQKRRAHTCFCRLCCLLPPTFQLKHVWNKQYVNHLLWIYERKANICARKECASFLHVFALRLWGQSWCICSRRLLKKRQWRSCLCSPSSRP